MKRIGIGILLCAAVLVGVAFAHPSTTSNTVAVVAYTSNQSLAFAQSGSVVTNSGASGAVTLGLPDAVAGLYFVVSLAAAQDVNVDPASGDRILGLTDNAGDQISSDATIRSTVELVGISDSAWLPISTTGVWSDAN